MWRNFIIFCSFARPGSLRRGPERRPPDLHLHGGLPERGRVRAEEAQRPAGKISFRLIE